MSNICAYYPCTDEQSAAFAGVYCLMSVKQASPLRERLSLTKYDKLIIMVSNADAAHLTALLLKKLA